MNMISDGTESNPPDSTDLQEPSVDLNGDALALIEENQPVVDNEQADP